jgi:hypothetical protein
MLDAAAKRSRAALSDYARVALLGCKRLRKARMPAIEAALLAQVLAKLGAVAVSLRELSGNAQLWGGRGGLAAVGGARPRPPSQGPG